MEFLNDAFAALNAGVDTLTLAVKPALALLASFVLVRLRTEILSGVPAVMQAMFASLFELVVTPLVNNAVRSAEEHGNRLAKEAVQKLQTTMNVHAVKLDRARAHIRNWVPDRLIDDATVDRWIDAALVRLGLGATKAVKIGVEYIEDTLREVPPPPAA